MKCIFLDINGTILDHEIGIQPSTILAIKQAQANGHKVCIATGRAKPEVDQQILNIGLDGYIYSCGSFVEVNNVTLFKRYMDISDTKYIIQKLHKHHIGFNLEGSHASFLDEVGYSFFHNLFINELQTNSELVRQRMASFHMNPYEDMKEHGIHQILKIAIFANSQQACIELQKDLPSHLRLLLHGTQESSIINGEIMYCDISKASGMDYILHHYQISLSNTYAIGDSMNDADMIKHARFGVAMANATEDLKKISDDITTSSKNNGIYESFKKHGLLL